MKKLFSFYFFLFTIHGFFAQNINGEVEYVTRSYQCTHCSLKSFSKSLNKIYSVSDYKFLPHLYFTALDNQQRFGTEPNSTCRYTQSGSHDWSEFEIPKFEKQKLNGISKTRYKGDEYIRFDRMQDVCKPIENDYIKWKKIYDAEVEISRKKKAKEDSITNVNYNIIQNSYFSEVSKRLDSVLSFNDYIGARSVLKKSLLLKSEKWDFLKHKVDSTEVVYLNILIENNDFINFDKLMNLEKAEIDNAVWSRGVWCAMDPQTHTDLKNKRIKKENDNNFAKLIAPIINKPLLEDELKLLGTWDFKSKNVQPCDGCGTRYFLDVIQLNKDRTFYFLIKEFYFPDNSHTDFSIEKTGYWSYENNVLTFYVDYETINKNKQRVNNLNSLSFTSLEDLESKKSMKINYPNSNIQVNLKMTGKKRSN